MKVTGRIKLGAAGVILLLLAAVLHYNLPRTSVVQVMGTDVKRMDSKGETIKDVEGQEVQTSSVRDVRFINTVGKNGKPQVFRNEDTRWGFPPYLKFNSADITAQAQTFSTSAEKPWVLVKYYGWRIRMLDSFPNVISMKQVTENYTHFPLFNILFLTVLVGVGVFLGVRARRMWRKISGRFHKEKDNKADQS